MARTAKPKLPAFKTSGYAALDVTTGRKALEKYLAKVGKVGATIDVVLNYASSRDDGVSIEFVCSVKALKNVRAA